MKLSIIIPVFNESSTVIEILERVKKEPIPGVDKEIVVVGDGSTDGSIEKLKSLKSKEFNIFFMKKIKEKAQQ